MQLMEERFLQPLVSAAMLAFNAVSAVTANKLYFLPSADEQKMKLLCNKADTVQQYGRSTHQEGSKQKLHRDNVIFLCDTLNSRQN